MGRSLADLAIEARTPLFWMKGKPIFPIMGGDGTGEENDDEEDKSDDDQEDSSDEDDPSARRVKELSDENAKRRNENKRLAKDLEAAQKRLKEIDDADRSETEKLATQVEELTATNEKLINSNKQLSIKNAFLADKTRSWRNPDTAMKLLDLDGVEIDDEGKITGLDKAIKKLADSDSYLLAPQDDDTGLPKPPAQPTGDKPGGRKSKDEVSREHLIKKYHLDSHVPA